MRLPHGWRKDSRCLRERNGVCGFTITRESSRSVEGANVSRGAQTGLSSKRTLRLIYFNQRNVWNKALGEQRSMISGKPGQFHSHDVQHFYACWDVQGYSDTQPPPCKAFLITVHVAPLIRESLFSSVFIFRLCGVTDFHLCVCFSSHNRIPTLAWLASKF